jgi:hypothetical protein
MAIMTIDDEWSHEELYGVLYDECNHACQGLKYLLDIPDLKKPYVLAQRILTELGDKNLVDMYDKFYMEKAPHESSDDVFARYDEWMLAHIQNTLKAHKSKHYIK